MAKKHRYRSYPLPAGLDVKEVVIRQLRGRDEIDAALAADQIMTDSERKAVVAHVTHEKREAIRLSLARVDGVRVNIDGAPYMAADEWTMATWTAVAQCFSDLNGIPGDELGKMLAAAKDVDLDAAPIPSPGADGTGK